MGRARFDQNNLPSLFGVSSADGVTPVEVWVDPTTHQLLTNATGGSSSGVIIDGVSSTIKATVFDLTNSNPLAAQIVDANGDAITSFGGGVQYTEDAAAAADPVGTAPILVRKDTPAATVSTDGDNIAQRGTNFGAAYVTLLDSSGNTVAVGGGTQYTQDAALTVGTSVGTMSMGRASAAAPTDVSADNDAILPWYLRNGAQATVLTAAGALIGGDAANGLDVDVTRLPALVAGTALIGKVGFDQTTPGTTNAVSIAQIGSTTITAGNGVTGAGSQRVTIASDNTPFPIKIDQTTPGTTNAFAVAQIGSTTVATGNGVVGAGVQRVAIASDNTAFAVNATLSAETTKVIGTINIAAAQTLATVTTVGTVTNITNWGNIVDNAGFTDGTTRLSMSGYIFDEVAGTALTENDAAAARINANRAQVFVMEDGANRARYQTVTTRGSALIEGPTASDAVLAAAPVTTGGKASSAVPTAMSADGDVVDRWHDRNGRTVIQQIADTATLSNVAGSASAVTVLASNTARKGAIIYNDSTAVLYLKMGSAASSTSFTVKMQPDDYYEAPFGYTNILTGIWASATGSARVTEIT
jgi:hypothetical protein